MSKYETTSIEIRGAICGRMWMPAAMGTLGYHGDVERVLARFSDANAATMRDVLLHELIERGGDFQDSRFTADTTITVTRKAPGGRTHAREISIAAWRDCADLVNLDVYSHDFNGEDN